MIWGLLPALVASTVTAGDVQQAEPGSVATDVQAAVERAVPYLKAEGQTWMDKRGCVSCHQVPFMIWSLTSANEHGFDVSREELDQWQSWSTDVVNFVKPEQKENVDVEKTLTSNIDTMTSLMMAMDPFDGQRQWTETFADALIANQEESGTWKPCGQLPLQKRPSEETTRVTTIWALLALQNQGSTWPKQTSALEKIDAGGEAKSTEWWASRLLLALARNERNVVSRLRNTLLEQQNGDGGWGWIVGEASDALGTGLALYALKRCDDMPAITTASKRATKFLISTQKDDGSWTVNGTKRATKAKPTPTANYWGTAWAVIALLQAD
ncbi:MAG: terpene cyclase/mutase family protein [Pirellulaceae bacterium]|nr:terpene cyclase/mutase family protein [Pirellulaceae bacterium]